ncbi:hypothetical protein [Kutzneria sp. CA-103260]|uniref:hypothetical protein n=1 Tax=Kutzneria sp. CA-103260 TaxID=2802641 RepID=UPI001BAA17F1|nr:hypothetical protein [Kutzneria sp. CA-103260]QUQ70992.1 hypothetical protein JJ691_87750 [Kutzneria sp. CA-103260]
MGRWLPAVLGVLLLSACGAGPTHALPPTMAPYVPPVDCGTFAIPGGQRDLVSPAMPAGTAACDEAFKVLTSYYRDAPRLAQGTARRLVVSGWTCEADIDDHNMNQVGCDKNGLAFVTQRVRA